ncbi:MAG: site-2 protease family protein [Deltaproteobacteria bacterium]|nr:site-2 protease family protein [Deltaproteobacteria bacterium]
MIERLPYVIIFYPVLLFSLSLHEAAHAWVANRKGDPTARLLGRITLNPVPHMDLMGTVILPLAALLMGAPLFGWGKPVPVDGRYLRQPRRDFLWIAAAGPISNICLAACFALGGRALMAAVPHLAPIPFVRIPFWETAIGAGFAICQIGVLLNMALALFNLIPIFPLDGGSVLRGLLPARSVPAYDRFAQYGLLMLVILFVSGALRFLAIPISVASAWLLPL